MDAIKSFVEKQAGGSNEQNNNNNNNNNNNSESSGGNSLLNSLNSMAGGGKESEKNEDYLDKAVDAVQQYVLKQGDQSNESAVEQAKDEQISDFIRTQYKNTTGKDFIVKDKDTNLGL